MIWKPLLVVLVVSALAARPLAALQPHLDPDGRIVILTQFATAAGALTALLTWRGRLPHPTTAGPHPPLGPALVVVPAGFCLAAAATGTLPHLEPALWTPLLPALLALHLLGALAEEAAWRGIVQPALETRTGVWTATVATGLLFGLGHVHVLAAGTAVYATFVVSAVLLSVLITVVTRGGSRRRRVVVATSVHWLVNSTVLLCFGGGEVTLRWTSTSALAVGLVTAGIALAQHHRPRSWGPTAPRSGPRAHAVFSGPRRVLDRGQ